MIAHATRGPQAGFTLIEMLASVFLTSIVISVAVGFYISLSRATDAATVLLRDSRHAATIMDRIARDLQSTMLLVKPAEMDPLDHPWLFLAKESTIGEGADRIKFIARSTRSSHATTESGSDLATVSYQLAPSEDEDTFELFRFSKPGLPEGLERDFDEIDSPGARLVASDIESFSLHFRRGGEDWLDAWDSSLLSGSSQLPDEVELRIALRSGAEADPDDPFAEVEAARLHKRRVPLLMRPIDLEAQIGDAIAAAGEGSGEDGCITVGECLEKPQNQALWQEYFDRCAADPVACAQIDSSRTECYTPDLLPGAVGCGR